jgi:hypothetical protein
MKKAFFVMVAAFGTASSVYCAGMSSLTTAPEYFDNNIAPAPRIAGDVRHMEAEKPDRFAAYVVSDGIYTRRHGLDQVACRF